MVEDTVRYRRAGFWGTPQFEYRNSGYDRGHMANHSAFDFDERVHETFNFINIVPQTRFINRTVIKYLEEYERKLTSKYGCLYFVIRAVYEEIGADVPMPTLPPGIPIYFIREVYTCDATLVTSFKIENIP
jgi:DNA/RNA endonuclease G (NUC1)